MADLDNEQSCPANQFVIPRSIWVVRLSLSYSQHSPRSPRGWSLTGLAVALCGTEASLHSLTCIVIVYRSMRVCSGLWPGRLCQFSVVMLCWLLDHITTHLEPRSQQSALSGDQIFSLSVSSALLGRVYTSQSHFVHSLCRNLVTFIFYLLFGFCCCKRLFW